MARKDTYTTKQGDTWDNIALEVYGEERHADFLMQSNYAFLDILVFSAGTVLNTPVLPEERTAICRHGVPTGPTASGIHTTNREGGWPWGRTRPGRRK